MIENGFLFPCFFLFYSPFSFFFKAAHTHEARKNALQEKLVAAVKLFVSRAGRLRDGEDQGAEPDKVVGFAETEAVVEALEAGEKQAP